MSDVVQALRDQVPQECMARTYAKGSCSISMKGVPANHATVDMDCGALGLAEDAKRCDLLFVGEDDNDAWVAPIELKSGAFSARSVKEQLQGGADLANRLLPRKAEPHFVPVLAHGRGIRKEKTRTLQAALVAFRGQRHRPKLIRCGSPLSHALALV